MCETPGLSRQDIFKHRLTGLSRSRSRPYKRSTKGATSPNKVADYTFQSKKTQIRFAHKPVPFTATFWQTKLASRILHESPFMDIEGVTAECFAIDRLHTWDLGPLQRFIALVFWTMIEFRVWESDIAYLDAACASHLCVLRLRGDMYSYYYRKRHSDPSWRKKGSEVTTLCVYVRGVCARVFAYKQTHTHKHQDQTLNEYGTKDTAKWRPGLPPSRLAADQACRLIAADRLAAAYACSRASSTGIADLAARAYMSSTRTILAPTKF